MNRILTTIQMSNVHIAKVKKIITLNIYMNNWDSFLKSTQN